MVWLILAGAFALGLVSFLAKRFWGWRYHRAAMWVRDLALAIVLLVTADLGVVDRWVFYVAALGFFLTGLMCGVNMLKGWVRP